MKSILQAFKLLLLITLCLSLTITLCGCKSSSTKKLNPPALDSGLPRINPTYVHWLSLQSMLGSADTYINQVSGTTRIWQNSLTEERFHFFLKACPNWLDLNPHLETALQPVFRTFSTPEKLALLPSLGLQGLFISPTSETADIWDQEQLGDPTGVDVVSFNLISQAGSPKDLERLLEGLNQNNLQLGGSLPPAALGIGPDFMLTTRAAQGFEGLFATVEIPTNHWKSLPNNPKEWPGIALSNSNFQELNAAGILPAPFTRDKFPGFAPGGWAATGKIRCSDGSERRWAYYYLKDVRRPLLLWQDPSNRVRKLYAAAVIRHTGLQQQALAGISLNGWYGFESTNLEANSKLLDLTKILEPGLSALESISQDVRRYGGWTLNTDQIPPSQTKYLLAKTDFARDNYSQAALDYALLTQDTEPLKAMLRLALKDQVSLQRLAHGLFSWEKTDWRVLQELPNGASLIAKVQGQSAQDLNFTKQTFIMGLPGLCFVNPKALNLGSRSQSLRANLNLKGSKASQDTLNLNLQELLLARTKQQVALGELLAPLSSPNGTIVVLNRLPSKNYWLTCANFSNRPQNLALNLPANLKSKTLHELGGNFSRNQGSSLNLRPHEVKIFMLNN